MVFGKRSVRTEVVVLLGPRGRPIYKILEKEEDEEGSVRSSSGLHLGYH